MGDLQRDLRYAVRMLWKSPAFSAVAILTLALGIGANTTIFSWVSAILLDPAPGAADPDRLAVFTWSSADRGGFSLSYPDYVDLRDGNEVLAGLTAYDMQAMNLGGGERPERIWGMIVTGNYFDVLGVRALYGRTFLPEEDRAPGERPVVVIGHGLWRRRFGGDPSIAGRTVLLNNRPFTIVGVAPPEFPGSYLGLSMDAWVPMMMQEVIVPGGGRLEARGNHWLDATARLKPGVDRRRAEASLTALAARIPGGREAPGTKGPSIALVPMNASGAGEILGPLLLVLLGVVGLLLLIACANVANLLLARSLVRRRETAIRLAIGAGRGRIVRQLLTESLLLALLGGAAGWLVALWTSGLLGALVPPSDFPVGLHVQLDTKVLAFNLAVAVLAGLLFGVIPAAQASRADLAAALKDDSSHASGGRRASRLRGALVVAQVSLSLLLLVCAGLFVRSLRNARFLDAGFDPKGVLLTSIDLFPSGYDAQRGGLLVERILRRVRGLPGVESATTARKIPLGFQGTSSFGLQVEGYEPAPGEEPWAFYNIVGSDYFRTLRIPIERGRDVTDGDAAGALPVAVVNASFVDRYWPGKDPLGRRILVSGAWVTVVGVARDSKYKSLNEPSTPYLFLPVLQFYRADITLHVRSSGDPASLAAAVAREIQAEDPSLPVFGVRTLEASIGAAMVPQRLGGTLLAAFGLLGLLMAAIGLYGVLAFIVSQRAREVGIRMALGAKPGDILRLVLGHGMKLTLIGAGLGLAAALAVTRLLAGFLFGVSPTDPLTFAAILLLLCGVALAACWLPARRATRVDPMQALRCE